MVKSSHDLIEQILLKNIAINKRELDLEDIDLDEFVTIISKLKLLRFLIKQAKSQILKRAGVERIEKKQRLIRNDTIDDFWKFMKNKCLDFEPYAFVERSLHVWLLNPEDRRIKIQTDSELLGEVLNNIIDNAVKYSFEAHEMKQRGVRYDEFSYNSDGNIHVSFKVNYSKLQIYISNWGYSLNTSEYNTVFEKNVRGSNAKSALGSGLGLYYVKSIIEILNGKVYILGEKSKTTFVVELNL